MIALLIASAVAAVVSLLSTRFLIVFFRSRGKGQPILGPEDRGPEHQHKAGTPTMGGIAILFAAAVGYLVAHFRRGAYFSDHALFIMGGIAALAALGVLDDLSARAAVPFFPSGPRKARDASSRSAASKARSRPRRSRPWL